MRDLTAVAKEGSHHWVRDNPLRICSRHSSRPTYVWRAAVESYSNPDRIRKSCPYLAFTSLMDGEYDPTWTFRQICLGRGIHPSMIPSAQRKPHPLPNHCKHRAKKPEKYLPRQFETRLKMDPARRAAIRAYKVLACHGPSTRPTASEVV